MLVQAVAQLIGGMQRSGEIDPALDAEQVAASLIAFFEGLYLHISLPSPNPEAFARSAIDLLRRSLLPSRP
jgi:hypothetical protein